MARQKSTSKENHYSFYGLTPLMAPVPPMLEKAIGYSGFAQFVSFYWTIEDDRAFYIDGLGGGTGNEDEYLTYVQHPTVRPLLARYNLGSSNSEAQHTLILDREERKLYVASIKDTEIFLAQQWPIFELEPNMSEEE